MDSLRGYFGSAGHDDVIGSGIDDSPADDDTGLEPPPSPIGQDERRMQVRAYNHWASLLDDRNFPLVEDLDPATLADFGPYSVLLDFTNGIDDPAVRYLGERLADECGISPSIAHLSDVPTRSLLSRITDHYMQILANQAPIGFEAEFVNQRGATIMYRGILLPYSSDDDTIDFIYGVINWKEMADQMTSDELMLEINQVLESAEDRPPAAPVTDLAYGSVPALAFAEPLVHDAERIPQPSFGAFTDAFEDAEDENEDEEEDAADLYEAIEAIDDDADAGERFASLLSLGGSRIGRAPLELGGADEFAASCEPAFGEDGFAEDDEEYYDSEDTGQDAALAAWSMPRPLQIAPLTPEPAGMASVHVNFDDSAPLAGVEGGLSDDPPHPAVTGSAMVLAAATDGEDLGLYDCLAAAREMALAARSCEDRSRSALYAAVGRAYDFSLAAQAEPEAFAELIAESGLTVQERAPMTPVVKLVFGADYDKTRLTEYAAVLSHAHRMGVERGMLAHLLSDAEGGLKGVVQAERDYRRVDAGGDPAVRETPREALARKLRAIAPLGFEDIEADGEEFALVVIRRTGGEIAVLGEVSDVPLVEKVAKKLVA
ncbi:hypothetical protein GRI40_09040 [Altererythrobacter aerius]|uniref:PAS domain-containing protein n=1 Tax=Tsuneonella aeria TaxID=1837929 RepID=A0A6I4TFH1_9SPHN|nr:hypothetical protein [Tsuneonella aeria]MXO75356.1 hypothetical protein [Tsuneonella aeria]